jgi:hypothetical protein
MYCVGLPVQTLFSVTVRLVEDAAPWVIANEDTAGGTWMVNVVADEAVSATFEADVILIR